MSLVMALCLLFMVLGLGLGRASHGRPQSRSATQVLAAFLQAQRELAHSSGQPVGVVWPASLSQGCQALQGWEHPRRVDQLELAREFPGFAMFVGAWNDEFVDQRPLWGNQDDSLDPAAWAAGRPALIFLPSGKVTASGVLRWRDSYRVAVGQRLTVEGDRLRAGQNCLDLRISPSGWADWAADLPLSPDGAPSSATALSLPASSRQAPQLMAVHIVPDPSKLDLPTGVQALVQAENFLSLTVEANTTTGQTLYCRWSGTGGSFSHQQRQPMQWEAAQQRWRSQTQWRPPDTAAHGSRFQLECHVTDEWGREAPSTLTSQVNLEVRDSKARLAFIEVGGAYKRMQVVHEDGTGKRELGPPLETSEVAKASWSPDGTSLAYVSQGKLYTCNAEGGARLQVDSGLPGQAVGLQGAYWNGDGTWIAHIRDLGGRSQVFLTRPDGSGAQNLNSTSSSDSFVRDVGDNGQNSDVCTRDNSVFAADGKYLATLRDGLVHLYPMPGSGADERDLPQSSGAWSVVWNPIHPWVAFSGSGQVRVYDLDSDSYFSSPNLGSTAGPGCFSPDGNRYFFGSGANMFMAQLHADHTLSSQFTGLSGGQVLGWLDDERYTYWKQSPSDLWLRDTSGNQAQNLTNEASDVMFCGWTR